MIFYWMFTTTTTKKEKNLMEKENYLKKKRDKGISYCKFLKKLYWHEHFDLDSSEKKKKKNNNPQLAACPLCIQPFSLNP